MGSFGQGGTRTARKDMGAVEVKVGGTKPEERQYLFYRVTAQGAEAVFSFSCEHQTRRSAGQFPGHPKQVYEWTWSKGGSESDAPDDVYGVLMSFVTATGYSLRVEHRRGDDSLIQLLKDIDYKSQVPQDSFNEPLRVFTSKPGEDQ